MAGMRLKFKYKKKIQKFIKTTDDIFLIKRIARHECGGEV